MIVSFNEIQTSCYKAFLGLRKQSGEADKVAIIVTNNELIGLPGVRIFAKALTYLKKDNDLPLRLNTSINKLVVDLKKCSIVVHIFILLDAAMNVLLGHDNVALHIKNTHNRWLSIGALMTMANSHPNIHIAVSWRTLKEEITCIFQAGNIYPTIFKRNHTNNEKIQDLIINISYQEMTQYSAQCMNATEVYTQKALKQYHQKSIQSGINIDTNCFVAIKQAAKAILVTETQASCQNAGE